MDSQVCRCYENTGYFVYCMNYYEVIIEEHNKGPGILTWKKPRLGYQNKKFEIFAFAFEKSTRNMVSLIFLPIENWKISRNVLHAILCPRPFRIDSLFHFTNYLDTLHHFWPLFFTWCWRHLLVTHYLISIMFLICTWHWLLTIYLTKVKLYAYYGNSGCRVFKWGYKSRKIFA